MLSDKVKELEAAYSRLHWLTGELMATLILPSNQKHIYEGKGLDELFRIIELNRTQFDQLPIPEEPAGNSGARK